MAWLSIVLVFALPITANATEVWRWTDPAGRVHYSNVPESVPAQARPLHGDLGYLAVGAVADVPLEPVDTRELERRRHERAIRRRLAEIEDFYDQVRARQRARLEAQWPNSTLLPDWLVADRWLLLKEEEARLRSELARF
jgi:hypothetical protein